VYAHAIPRVRALLGAAVIAGPTSKRSVCHLHRWPGGSVLPGTFAAPDAPLMHHAHAFETGGMAASAPRSAFAAPITLPQGRKLLMIQDAADYITALPEIAMSPLAASSRACPSSPEFFAVSPAPPLAARSSPRRPSCEGDLKQTWRVRTKAARGSAGGCRSAGANQKSRAR
jgi:hypothetical protein